MIIMEVLLRAALDTFPMIPLPDMNFYFRWNYPGMGQVGDAAERFLFYRLQEELEYFPFSV